MPRIALAPGVFQDFERILAQLAGPGAPVRLAEMLAALDTLAHSPEIGRPVRAGRHELRIGRGSSAHLALYRFVQAVDTVFVLGIRSRRGPGSKRQG